MASDKPGTDPVPALVSAWKQGDWDHLGDVESLVIEQHPHRALLAMVRLASRLEHDDPQAVMAEVDRVAAWGVDAGRAADVLLASALRDLAKARVLQGRPAHARRHLAEVRHRVANASRPRADAQLAADAARLRQEVLRLRQTVQELRQARPSSGPRPTDDDTLIQQILDAHLTYLSVAKMRRLAATARAIEEQRVPGVFIEAGCALGGSAILLARTKRPERPLRVHDVFGVIPPPSDRDPPRVHERYRTILEGHAQGLGAGERYYGYEIDLLSVVRRNLERFGVADPAQHVQLVQGLVQDTLVDDGPVALAHIDVDWHDPVKFCLEHLFPRLSIGGSIVVDDYHDWEGCRVAVDDFLSRHGDAFAADDSARSMKLTRIARGATA